MLTPRSDADADSCAAKVAAASANLVGNVGSVGSVGIAWNSDNASSNSAAHIAPTDSIEAANSTLTIAGKLRRASASYFRFSASRDSGANFLAAKSAQINARFSSLVGSFVPIKRGRRGLSQRSRSASLGRESFHEVHTLCRVMQTQSGSSVQGSPAI